MVPPAAAGVAHGGAHNPYTSDIPTADTQVTALKDERAKLTAAIEHFANAAARLGVVIKESDPIPAEQLQARHDRAQQEVADLSRQVEEAGVTLQEAEKVLADLRAKG